MAALQAHLETLWLLGYELARAVGINWDLIDPRYIPLLILLLRTANLALSTLRILFVMRGLRLMAFILAFLQNLLYITSLTGVLSNLDDPFTILAYAGGFATGNVLGMWVESRLAPGHSLLRITSSSYGAAILEILHEHGYGATELPGRGLEGVVSVVHCFAPRKAIARLRKAITAVDPQAFMSIQQVRQLQGGWRP